MTTTKIISDSIVSKFSEQEIIDILYLHHMTKCKAHLDNNRQIDYTGFYLVNIHMSYYIKSPDISQDDIQKLDDVLLEFDHTWREQVYHRAMSSTPHTIFGTIVKSEKPGEDK